MYDGYFWSLMTAVKEWNVQEIEETFDKLSETFSKTEIIDRLYTDGMISRVQMNKLMNMML